MLDAIHFMICLISNNLWKNNLFKFNGFFDIIEGKPDFYYLPNYYASKLSELFDIMYTSKIFLECAVPNSIWYFISF